MSAPRPSEVTPSEVTPSAVTIGKFDGLHRGHRALIDTLRGIADERGLRAVVVTFDRSPRELFTGSDPGLLLSLDQRVELLRRTPADDVVVLTFDRELAGVEPEDFVRDTLIGELGMRVIVVGRDFRFGAKARGDVALLQALASDLDFDVVVLPDQVDGDARVSSTAIRDAVRAGDVERAASLLGRLHAVRGEVVTGARRGRELGYPTANLAADSEGMVPADGVYAGWLVDDDGTRYPAAISVGSNPTFEGVPQQQVEAHLPGVDLDLYGHRVSVEFAHRLRGMVAYDGVAALIDQMRADVERTVGLLGSDPVPPAR